MPGETADGFTPGADFEDEAQPVINSPVHTWRRPKCGTHGSCVEIAHLPEGGVAIRDGKSGDASPVLRFTADEWDAFTAAIRTAELS